MSEVSNRRKSPEQRRSDHFESFGAWMFSTGMFGGFWIGYVVARLVS